MMTLLEFLNCIFNNEHLILNITCGFDLDWLKVAAIIIGAAALSYAVGFVLGYLESTDAEDSESSNDDDSESDYDN
jgi:hypothetical protein